MVKWVPRVFVLSLFLTLAACMSFGRDFPSQTSWIERGVTSQKDVLELMGHPYSVGNSNGTLVWTYLFSRYSMGDPLKQKELKLYWNDKNRVERYHFNSSFPRDLENYSISSLERQNSPKLK